jgi:hypothetical protein
MVDDPGEFETELLISSSLDLLQDPRIKTVRKLKKINLVENCFVLVINFPLFSITLTLLKFFSNTNI